MENQITATELAKKIEIRELFNPFLKDIKLNDFEIKYFPNHKDYSLFGIMADYLTRYLFLEKLKEKDLESKDYLLELKKIIDDHIVVNISLNILKEHNMYYKNNFFKNEFLKLEKSLEEEIYNYLFKKEKNFKKIFKTIYILSISDYIYRIGDFNRTLDKFLNFEKSLKDENFEKYEDLFNDFKNVYENLKRLLKNSFNIKNIKLNPKLGLFESNILIKADADLILENTLVEIKTSKLLKIKKEYLEQLLLYAILYFKNTGNKIENFKILNPRANNLIEFKINWDKKLYDNFKKILNKIKY